MAVWWTFREPSLGRHVHRDFMRKAALNVTLKIPATACHQRNYVERYSRFIVNENRHQEDERTRVNAKQEALLDERRKDSTDPQDMLGEHGLLKRLTKRVVERV